LKNQKYNNTLNTTILQQLQPQTDMTSFVQKRSSIPESDAMINPQSYDNLQTSSMMTKPRTMGSLSAPSTFSLDSSSLLPASPTKPQTTKNLKGGRRRRGIPRCSAIYGKEALEQEQECESLRQSRYEELQRLSQTEELQRGVHLPTM
jgi:hypothetical protein